MSTDQPEKRGPGRPKFIPTPEQRALVKQLVAYGIPQADIATFIKGKNGRHISPRSLAEHFKPELAGGLPEANARVAGRLFQEAMGGNVTAMIFWLKTRGRWSETPQQVAFTNPDGTPAQAPTLADFYQTVQMVSARRSSEAAQG